MPALARLAALANANKTPAHVLGACRPRDSAVADRLAAVVSEMRQLVGSGTVAEGGLLARGLCGLVRGVAGSTEARMAVGGGKSGAPAKPSVEAMQRRLVRGAELFSAVWELRREEREKALATTATHVQQK